MAADTSKNTYSQPNSTTYDMFYDDSLDNGVRDNEMDGVVDQFTVEQTGTETLSHGNIPKCDGFYAFVVTKIG